MCALRDNLLRAKLLGVALGSASHSAWLVGGNMVVERLLVLLVLILMGITASDALLVSTSSALRINCSLSCKMNDYDEARNTLVNKSQFHLEHLLGIDMVAADKKKSNLVPRPPSPPVKMVAVEMEGGHGELVLVDKGKKSEEYERYFPIFYRAWNEYEKHLIARPLLTKVVTSGCISFLGDIFCQFLSGAGLGFGSFSLQRTAVYTAIGTLWIPIAVSYWFAFLERLAESPVARKLISGNRFLGSKLRKVLFQLAIDQTLGSALVNGGFLLAHSTAWGVLGGKGLLPSAASARKEVLSDIVSVVRTSWLLWVPMNFLNFMWIPPRLRVGFTNLVALLWNVWLSARAHRAL